MIFNVFIEVDLIIDTIDYISFTSCYEDAFDAAERLFTLAAYKWNRLAKNEKQGYVLLGLVIVVIVITFRFLW